MPTTSTAIVLTREELYERVWSTPMQKLAVEFGLSDVGLAKICKKHKIPRPTRGHWAKVERGKKVDRWPLSPLKDESLREIRLHKSDTPHEPSSNEPRRKEPVAADPEIAALIEAESLPENRIEPLTDLRGADPLVTATRESLSKAKPDDYGRVSRRYDFEDTCFEVCVAKENVPRALLLLHSLLRAFKGRGYTIGQEGARKGDPFVQVLERRFKLSVWEPSKKQKRELTKAEIEEKKRWRYSFVREYEHVPTGVLELHVNRGSYSSTGKITDTKRAPLEQRLNDLVVCMLKTVDRDRIRAEEERQKAAEAAKQKQAAVEQEVIRRTESVREERLLNAIPRWENARRIRTYIDAVRAEAVRRFGDIDETSEIGRWLQWAEEYFQSVDPLSSGRRLPTFSLTAQELEKLAAECKADWCDWSKAFRPQQPR